MKIKEGFILQQVADSNVVVPVGEASATLNGIINLNASGVILWNLLAAGTDREKLVQGLTAEYDVSQDKALQGVDAFLDSLRKIGCLEE